MPRRSRRPEIVHAALDAFEAQGYEATTVADLARATRLSKAAVTYHFGTKDDLALELAGPLLDDIEALVARHGEDPPDTEPEALIADYLDALLEHRRVVRWLDGDKFVLAHDELGARLVVLNEAMHELLTGRPATPAGRVVGSALLGLLWRPVRNGYLDDDRELRADLIELAAGATRTARSARR